MITRDNKDETLIEFRGESYVGFSKLGFPENGSSFVLKLYTTPPDKQRGTSFTNIPISPLGYRRQHGTMAYAKRPKANVLVICSDHGRQYKLTAPPEIIDHLWQECIEQELVAQAQSEI